MTKTVSQLAIISIFLFPALVFANGAAIYDKAECFECHGDLGHGKMEKSAPRIAGQHDWYILTSLRAFKTKTRNNPEMFPYIKDLSDKDFQDLATYISKLR